MKMLLSTPAILLFATTSALAQTNTKTVDTPNYNGTRTTVIDKAAGTASRVGSLTRKSDGAVATRSADASRTDNGVSVQAQSSNFAGETRSGSYDRTRTDTGATATGSVTRRNGETLNYNGSTTRGDGRVASQQSVTGANGQSLFNRTATTTQSEAGVSRSVNATRAPRFQPRATMPGRGRRR